MKANAYQAAIFDVDGVLLDSLPQHLRICDDKAREYGLQGFKAPTVAEFRRMVGSGVRVSPMLDFFLALGFPPPLAQRGVEDYEREFMSRYHPDAFEGVEAMLQTVHAAGIHIGLVTSNTRANVEPALGRAMRYFDQRCVFYFDSFPEPPGKAWCLTECARALGLSTADCAYVGDQPADERAAAQAKMGFLGVTYGWGLTPERTDLHLVNDVAEVAGALLQGRAAAP